MENIKKDSLIEVIEDSIKKNWKQPAFTDYGTDTSYTYRDVAHNIARLHHIYSQQGIKPGDKICLCAKNSSRWAISALSILTYGAVLVPVLSDFSVEQIRNIYDHSDSVLMVCDTRLQQAFPHAIDISNLSFFNGQSTPPLTDFTRLKAKKISYFRENPNDLAIISYTSGSTGHSKGVMLPYRSVWSNAKFVDYIFDIKRNVDLLPLLPMSHMLGFAFEFIYGTCIGAHIHFLTRVPSPRVVLQAFQDIRPAMIVCVPLVIEKILQSKVFPLIRTPRFRFWLRLPLIKNFIYWQIKRKLYQAFGGKIVQAVIGGAALGREADDFLTRIHFPYSQGYGMTECGPLISFDNYKHARKGSCGRAIPRMTLRIDSPDPQHQPGEILTQGMNTMLGYYKNPEETAQTLQSDGWLHTGDLGTIDPDGYLYIRGRKKTMLLGANGQNIYPEEIEDLILTHTHFEECVVVQRGEKLAALVYISPQTMEQKKITRDHLDRHLGNYLSRINAKLPKFAHLSTLEIQDEEFEKTPKRSIRRYLYS